VLDLDKALDAIQFDLGRLLDLERARLDLNNAPLNPAQKDERDRFLKGDIERQRQLVLTTLRELTEFPPQHLRHANLLTNFYNGGADFEKSVFVMTKFPNTQNPTPADTQLLAIIQEVRDAVLQCGYTARVASDFRYHPILWDNVELYLLGCKRGIAVVEDKYFPELNPNVAMEWGWMRGMGRDVLYLVEDDFQKERADWGGLIEDHFDWDDPAATIPPKIKAWLKAP